MGEAEQSPNTMSHDALSLSNSPNQIVKIMIAVIMIFFVSDLSY